MKDEYKFKRLLKYNPKTGEFIWLKSKGSNKAGDIAGGLINGYVKIKVNNRNHYAHRLAWFYVYGAWPENQIDHINHDRSDNRIDNLREVTGKENSKNQKMHITNSSGVTGVYWRKDRSKWRAAIHVNNIFIGLGSYIDKFEAICARKSAEVLYGYHPNHGL